MTTLPLVPPLPVDQPLTRGIELHRARYIADRICDLLRPATAEIVVAGSIRRQKPQVGDIEIVACLREDLTIPHAEHEFSNVVRSLVECDPPAFSWDLTNRKNGPRCKRVVVQAGQDLIGVDLFIADRDNFGNILAIRTGGAEFSQALVTRGPAGLMPSGLQQKDGYLWRRADTADAYKLLSCRTEVQFFCYLGFERVIEPQARTMDTVRALISQRKAGGR